MNTQTNSRWARSLRAGRPDRPTAARAAWLPAAGACAIIMAMVAMIGCQGGGVNMNGWRRSTEPMSNPPAAKPRRKAQPGPTRFVEGAHREPETPRAADPADEPATDEAGRDATIAALQAQIRDYEARLAASEKPAGQQPGSPRFPDDAGLPVASSSASGHGSSAGQPTSPQPLASLNPPGSTSPRASSPEPPDGKVPGSADRPPQRERAVRREQVGSSSESTSTPPAISPEAPAAPVPDADASARANRSTGPAASNAPVVAMDAVGSPRPPRADDVSDAPTLANMRVELVDVRPAGLEVEPAGSASSSGANQPVARPATSTSGELGALIDELRETVRVHPERVDAQFRLRLLLLATGQDDEAVEPAVMDDPVQAKLLGTLFRTVRATRAAMAQPMEEADDALMAVMDLQRLISVQSPVVIPKIALVTRVDSFGDYEEVASSRFPADRPVHVFCYTEVANFRSEPTEEGRLRTVLGARLEVYNDRGKLIWDRQVPRIEDRVLTPRRDFFVPLEVRLPADTPAGRYVLKVTIEDQLGATADQQRLTFRIGD